MITYFPVPYPDECLYSLIARYHVHTNNRYQAQTINELFKRKIVRASIDLQLHLDEFRENVQTVFEFSTDEIINKFSLWPFYSSFIDAKRHPEIIEAFKARNSQSLYQKTGFEATSSIRKNEPKFCPICFENDLKQYGEGYWHRMHQLPEVNVCSLHNTFLVKAHLKKEVEKDRFFFAAEPETCIYEEPVVNKNEMILKIAEIMFSILATPEKFYFSNRNYLEEAKELGYVRGSYLNIQLLKKDIQDFYSEETLNFLFRDNISFEKSLFNKLIYKPHKISNPLRHIIISHFLENKLKPSCQRVQPHAFTKALWECINIHADHYGEFVINDFSVKSDRKKYFVTASCKCGMVYTKSFERIEGINKYKEVVRVKKYGQVWVNRLKDLVKERLTLKRIAEVMDVAQDTVIYHARENGIPLASKKKVVRRGKNHNTNFEQKVSEYKRRWTIVLDENPGLYINELKIKDRTAYYFLMENDRDWILAANLPRKRKKRCETKEYVKEDEELLMQIENTLNALISQNLPKQLTSRFICYSSGPKGKNAFIGKLINFPLTKEYLEKNSETLEEYQIRRMRNAASFLYSEGKEICKSKIFTRARITRRPLPERIQIEVERILESYRI